MGAGAGGACRSRGAAGAGAAAAQGGEGARPPPHTASSWVGEAGTAAGWSPGTCCHNDSGPGMGTVLRAWRGDTRHRVTEGPLTLSQGFGLHEDTGLCWRLSLICPHPAGHCVVPQGQVCHSQPGFGTQRQDLSRRSYICRPELDLVTQSWASPPRAEICHPEPRFATQSWAVPCFAEIFRVVPGGREAGPWLGATRVNILLERWLLAHGHLQPLEHREIRGTEPVPGSPFLVPAQRRLPSTPPRDISGGDEPPLRLLATPLSPCLGTPMVRWGREKWPRCPLDVPPLPAWNVQFWCRALSWGMSPRFSWGKILRPVGFSMGKISKSWRRARAGGHSPG